MKLRFTPSARRQFLHAVAFIMEDNPDAALKFRKRVERTFRRLPRFPDSRRHASIGPREEDVTNSNPIGMKLRHALLGLRPIQIENPLAHRYIQFQLYRSRGIR